MTTRAEIESVLVQRFSLLLTLAGMETTIAGSNASLNDPIGYALRYCGYTVASLTSVSDADLSAIESTDLDKLLDVAEIRALDNIHGNVVALVDITNGPEKESFSQSAIALEKRIKRLQDKFNENYGTSGTTVRVGVISHDFVEHNDNEITYL